MNEGDGGEQSIFDECWLPHLLTPHPHDKLHRNSKGIIVLPSGVRLETIPGIPYVTCNVLGPRNGGYV
jgi:hypothetical protein